ncbi:MAG: hypothetical protein LQ342_005212 [Letrouitia transgressa]|nr:MAG: hypothetical protein LQ342_005212 [Letrouitia transgressa]
MLPSRAQEQYGKRRVKVLKLTSPSHYKANQRAVDQELSAKIESELQVEKETRDSEQLPASIKDFLDNSDFQLEDAPGQEEVVLKRKFGDESISVTFSIVDLNNIDQDPDQLAEDKAMYDEDAAEAAETNAQSGGANTKGAINQGRTNGGNFNVAPEDSVAESDREAMNETPDQDREQEPSFPVRVNVFIEKAGRGCLQFEMTAEDGHIFIENVYYFGKAELAHAKTAESDWARRNLYTGPPFGNLDEDLQVLLERYLEERGIDARLALWVPEYIDFKEQREYLNWLSTVKSFVDA